MEIFLTIMGVVFFIIGSLFLLSPKTVVKASNFLNFTLFKIDKKIHAWRRPFGILFLLLSIFSWYIGFPK